MTDYAEISPIFLLVMLAIIGLIVWRWMKDDDDDEPDYSVRMPAAANCDTENDNATKNGCAMENDNSTDNDNGKENDMSEEYTERSHPLFYSKMSAKESFKATLNGLGCQCHEQEDDANIIWFGFQGEQFRALTDDSSMIIVQDLNWLSVPLGNLEELSMLYKAVNEANKNAWVIVCYTTDTEEQTVDVHSMMPMSMSWQMAQDEGYVKHMLGRFFWAKRIVYMELDRMRTAVK